MFFRSVDQKMQSRGFYSAKNLREYQKIDLKTAIALFSAFRSFMLKLLYCSVGMEGGGVRIKY
jgi:hypothetical protein